MDYRGDLFYTSVFKNSFFLAKTLLFQSTVLSSVTGKSLCTLSFLAFKGLSLTENLRIFLKSTNRKVNKETKLKHVK